MEPIINPWYFYIVNLSGGFRNAFLTIGIILLIIAVITGIAYCLSDPIRDEDWNRYLSDETAKENLKFLHTVGRVAIICAIVGFILVVISLLIPSTMIAYQMLAASLITPDNLSAVGGSIESIIDYVIEISQQLAP